MKFYKYVSESRYEPVIEIPDNATNGDMIKTMFPNEVGYGEGRTCIYYGTMRFDRDWWNSPYRKGQE